MHKFGMWLVDASVCCSFTWFQSLALVLYCERTNLYLYSSSMLVAG